MTRITVSTVIGLALSIPTLMLGQDKGGPVPTQPATQAPTKAFVFQGQNVQAQLAKLIEQVKVGQRGGAELARTGNIALQLSVMPKSGPGELHRHNDDLLIIQQGSATLVTGGTMLNGKDRPSGDTYGSGLEGGETTTLNPGDIAIVPAGLTHQLVIAPGTVLTMIVGKIQEP